MRMLKKIMLVATACVSILSGFTSMARESKYVRETIDGIEWCYSYYDDNLGNQMSISTYERASYGTITMPDMIGGVKVENVKVLGNMGNTSWIAEHVTVDKFIIPEGVKVLESSFTRDGLTVKEFVFPSSLTTLDGTFYLNGNLNELTIPDTVTTITGGSFGCSSIKKIKMSENVTTLEELAFWNCIQLSEVILPSKLTKIEDRAFMGCTSLKKIMIPRTVTEIVDSRSTNGLAYSATIPKYITIYGYKNSAAQLYAKKYGNKFVDVEKTVIPQVSNLRINKVKTTSLKLNWNKAKNATEYKIYRAVGTSNKFKLLITTKSTNYTDKNLKTGTIYKYKVRGYSSKTKESSLYSDIATTVTQIDKIQINKISTKGGKVTLNWGKVSNISGYEIVMSTNKKGIYENVATVSKQKTVKYTVNNLEKGKVYYFKIRGYKVVNDETIYGSYSAVKSIKIK